MYYTSKICTLIDTKINMLNGNKTVQLVCRAE